MTTRLSELKSEFDSCFPDFKERIENQCDSIPKWESLKWKRGKEAKNWFKNHSEIDSNIDNDIRSWYKNKVSKWEEGDLFRETKFEYTESEKTKILKHRKWEKMAINVARVALFVLLCTNFASVVVTSVFLPLALPLQVLGELLFGGLFCATLVETLRQRKVRLIENRNFQRFVEDYVVRKDEKNKYPDEQLLTDKNLHQIYHAYRRDLLKADKYVAMVRE